MRIGTITSLTANTAHYHTRWCIQLFLVTLHVNNTININANQALTQCNYLIISYLLAGCSTDSSYYHRLLILSWTDSQINPIHHDVLKMQWRFYGGGANRALAPQSLIKPPKVCGLIGLNNCIVVTAIQLMRLFRNAMTVSKIFSSTEAKMVHIWPLHRLIACIFVP